MRKFSLSHPEFGPDPSVPHIWREGHGLFPLQHAALPDCQARVKEDFPALTRGQVPQLEFHCSKIHHKGARC